MQFFYIIFIKHFQNVLKISQHFPFFVRTRDKLTHVLLKILKIYANIMHFSNVLKKAFENLLKNSITRGFRPNTKK